MVFHIPRFKTIDAFLGKIHLFLSHEPRQDAKSMMSEIQKERLLCSFLRIFLEFLAPNVKLIWMLTTQCQNQVYTIVRVSYFLKFTLSKN